jgi:hypothetical protein
MSTLSGHSVENDKLLEAGPPVSVDYEEVEWRARRDSNSRPIAPEAIALSS